MLLLEGEIARRRARVEAISFEDKHRLGTWFIEVAREFGLSLTPSPLRTIHIALCDATVAAMACAARPATLDDALDDALLVLSSDDRYDFQAELLPDDSIILACLEAPGCS